MPYSVTNSDGSLTVSVADGTVDTTTFSLALVGRNVSNYGEYFVRNSIRHLENFAGTTAPSPSTVLEGQLWYDKAEELLKVWDGARWKRSTSIVVSATAPSTSLTAGTAYFNTINDKLYVHDGSTFKPAGYAGEITNSYSATTNIGSPNNYGTKLRNIFLKDSAGVDRAVLALTYVNDSANGSVNQGTTTTVTGKETIMAIFSDHAQFIAQNASSASESETINYYNELTASGGIGATIYPGLNLRSEYDTTSLALTDRAYRADAAYVLNTGTFGSDSANISANDVIHTGRGYVPASSNSYNLGSATYKFADLHTGTVYLGNGTSGTLATAGTVSIGNATNYVNHVYANNITVADIINFSTADLGTALSPILNGFFANVTATTGVTVGSGATNYTLPISRGTNGQALVLDGSGVASWQTLAGDIESVTAGNGLTGGGSSGAVTLNIGAGVGIAVNADDIALASNVAGAGLTFTTGVLAVGAGNGITVNADDIALASSVAGNGLTYTTGVLAINLSDSNVFASTNTASRAVVRDASGNFAANVVTATATTARYADLAEKYLADAEYEIGTVMVVGGEKEVTASTAFGQRAIGVVSGAPAYMMNSELEGGTYVALKGRVPVKVSGVVNKGDRLIASTNGRASAGVPHSSDVFAIALESKAEAGDGVVEAVIL